MAPERVHRDAGPCFRARGDEAFAIELVRPNRRDYRFRGFRHRQQRGRIGRIRQDEVDRFVDLAFSYEGAGDEASFVLGPALVGLLASLVAPWAPFALAAALISRQWLWLLAIPLVGYGFAWVGHFFFEHNRPATFRHPFYSLLGDWVMFKDMLIGRVRF